MISRFTISPQSIPFSQTDDPIGFPSQVATQPFHENSYINTSPLDLFETLRACTTSFEETIPDHLKPAIETGLLSSLLPDGIGINWQLEFLKKPQALSFDPQNLGVNPQNRLDYKSSNSFSQDISLSQVFLHLADLISFLLIFFPSQDVTHLFMMANSGLLRHIDFFKKEPDSLKSQIAERVFDMLATPAFLGTTESDISQQGFSSTDFLSQKAQQEFNIDLKNGNYAKIFKNNRIPSSTNYYLTVELNFPSLSQEPIILNYDSSGNLLYTRQQMQFVNTEVTLPVSQIEAKQIKFTSDYFEIDFEAFFSIQDSDHLSFDRHLLELWIKSSDTNRTLFRTNFYYYFAQFYKSAFPGHLPVFYPNDISQSLSPYLNPRVPSSQLSSEKEEIISAYNSSLSKQISDGIKNPLSILSTVIQDYKSTRQNLEKSENIYSMNGYECVFSLANHFYANGPDKTLAIPTTHITEELERLSKLSRLMQNHLIYCLNYDPLRKAWHIFLFVFDTKDKEWKYFGTLLFDKWGMPQIQAGFYLNENEKKKFISFDHKVKNIECLTHNNPEDKSYLRSINHNYEIDVLDFLQALQDDNASQIFQSLSGKEIFSGKEFVELSYVSFYFTPNIAPAMRRFVNGSASQSDLKSLALRFSFVMDDRERYSFFGKGEIFIDQYNELFARRRIFELSERKHQRMQVLSPEQAQNGFSVVIDLDVSQMGPIGGSPTGSKTRSKTHERGSNTNLRL